MIDPTQAPQRSRRPWWLLLLPLAFLLHIAEELWGGEGFPAWTGRLVEEPISIERFLSINAVGWPIFALLTLLGITRPAVAWLPTALATMLLVNAALHALGSAVTAAYSPGLVTSLLLYPPIGIAALRHGKRNLPPGMFARAILGGVLVHAAVLIAAFA